MTFELFRSPCTTCGRRVCMYKSAPPAAAAAPRDELVQRHALDELQDYGDPVLLREDHGAVGGHDVGVPQAAQDAQLVAQVLELHRGLVEPAAGSLDRDVHPAEDALRHVPEAAEAQAGAGQHHDLVRPDPPPLGVADLRHLGQLGLDVDALPEERAEDRAGVRGRRDRAVHGRDGFGHRRDLQSPPQPPRLQGLLEGELGLAPEALLPRDVEEGVALAHLCEPLARRGADDEGRQADTVHVRGHAILLTAAHRNREHVEQDARGRQGDHDEPSDRQ
eukprot:CAMPEP_0175245980 /NCGR_PEP_ID=MMETSP0093-20121207/32870_1 /TAXON_ID=311494 /ORGANISM="Alexandrium monilatum, Strain CCMP3105" /LENGTH=276 /DNA_ID=CAMNT_0016540117 /DNA_START=22 /DNA_END=849 /DNA_ORIENTATION=+